MIRRILIGASSLVAVLTLSATSAFAATYTDGTYSGTVVQGAPSPYTGSIGFQIHGGVLSGLHFKVKMKCADLYWAEVKSPPSASSLRVTVGQDGKFSYSGTVSGTEVQLTGEVTGENAVGTFLESFHTSASSVCAMAAAAPFSAGYVTAPSASGSKAAAHATRRHSAGRHGSGRHHRSHHGGGSATRRRHRGTAGVQRGTLVNPGL